MNNLSFAMEIIAPALAAGSIVVVAAQSGFSYRPRMRIEGPAPRRDAWRVIGPGGGSSSSVNVFVSPHDVNKAFATNEMSGAYITCDCGNSWRMFNLGAQVNVFAFDPQRSEVVYAGSNCLWRSENGGTTWRLLYPSPAANTVMHLRTDHADQVICTDDVSYPSMTERLWLKTITVHPKNPDFLAFSYDRDRGQVVTPTVFVSEDFGKSWRVARQFENEGILFVDIDGETSLLTVVTTAATYAQEAAGWSRRPIPADATFEDVSGGRDKTGGLVIYATGSACWAEGRLCGGVLVSRDRGVTWEDVTRGIGEYAHATGRRKGVKFKAVSCCGVNADEAYVGFKALVLRGRNRGSCNGIARTSDGGASWKIVRSDERLPAVDTKDTFLKRRQPAGDVVYDTAISLATAPSSGDVCYAADPFRLYRTREGGRTWQVVNSAMTESGIVTSGMDFNTIFGLHFDPFDERTVFASCANVGLCRSHDGGWKWHSSTEGVPDAWRNSTYWVEFDEDAEGLMWAACSGTRDLPRTKMWRRRPLSTYRGGICISHDSGLSWRRTKCETDKMAVTHVVMDRRSPVGRRTLYACGFGKGALKSTDNGLTWRLCNNGIEYEEPLAWRMTLGKDGTLYLVVSRRHEWGESNPNGIGAVYRSYDGAETWERMTLPEGTDGPCSITIDPKNDHRLYLSAWGRVTSHEDTGGGIFISDDAGLTWRNVMSDDQHIYDVTIDERVGRLYACGFESAAYGSDDRGESWERIRGYNFRWGHRVVCDPSDSEKIYITTFGGGIWHGPSAGDPEAQEDTLTLIPKRRFTAEKAR